MLRFPEVEEIPLENSPIAEVICQVRFPTLLRIAAEQPVEFQERIRDHFPFLEVQHRISVQVDTVAGSHPTPQAEPRLFRFISSDGATIASLTPDFFAISTTDYKNWETFLAQINLISNAAIDVYKLSNATRIGLRYVNRITPNKAGVTSVSELWSILRPELTTLWATDSWDAPIQAAHQIVLSTGNAERLTLRAGFQQDDEPTCILDLDCYTETDTEISKNLSERLRRYHDLIYGAFRWCVRDEKLVLFKSGSVSEGRT